MDDEEAPANGNAVPAAIPGADVLQRAIRTALRLNEIGSASPYQISFAGKGKSGASFGFMQGDLCAGAHFVKDAFMQALSSDGVGGAQAQTYLAALSKPIFNNPLSASDTEAVNAALNAASGRPIVDAMDERLCSGVLQSVDTCVAAATAAGRGVNALARIYMALWINMTGPPTTLLNWLKGEAITLRRPVQPAGAMVDGPAMEQYLAATDYFVENPGNLPHTLHSAAGGALVLQA
jgi:hypothetical protein